MYLLLCPCIFNPSLRAKDITHERDLQAFEKIIQRCKKFGITTHFLPCTETIFLGPDHLPGYYVGRLDTPEFEKILHESEKKVRELFQQEGYPYAIIGVDSSPVCGVHNTWYGSIDNSPAKISGRGVFLKRFSEIPAIDVFEAAKYMVYLAAPLFSEAEREYNQKISNILTQYAMDVYLPQNFGDTSHSREEFTQKGIFNKNSEALNEADIIISIIDGADADSGTSWEIGYAYAKGKKIISLRTDFRKVGCNESVNLMLEQSSIIVSDIPSLVKALPCPIPVGNPVKIG